MSSRLRRSPWTDWRLWTALLVAGIGVAVRLNNAFRFPIEFGFDASFNRSYIERLCRSWILPAPDAGWSTAHAPLFYYLSAALVRLGGWRDPAEWVPLIRLVGTAAGLGVVGAALTVVRRVSPTDRLRAVLAAGVVIFLPVHIYMSAMLGEEMLAALFSSLALAGAIGATRPDRPVGSLWRAAWIGCAAGAALLTKLSGALVVAPVVCVYAQSGMQSGSRRPALARIAVFALFTFLVGGWFYARNWLEYGYLYPHAMPFHQVMASMPPGERGVLDYLRLPSSIFSDPQLLDPDLLESVWGGTYVTTWFDGHRHFLPVASGSVRATGTWILALALLPSFAFAIGLARGVGRFVRSRNPTDTALVVFVVLTLAGYALFTLRNPWFAVVKGSYLLGLCVPFAFYASEVLAAWARLGGVRSTLVWVGLGALTLSIAPTFSYGLVFEKRELPGLAWLESATPIELADSPDSRPIALASETRMATTVLSQHRSEICLPPLAPGRIAVEVGVAAGSRGAEVRLRAPGGATAEVSPRPVWSRLRIELPDRPTGCIAVEVSGAAGTKVALSTPLLIRSNRPRPWVVLYVVDGLRFDDTPYGGAEPESAPGFASFAADGILYRRAFATSPWTRSAVASLLTGLYSSSHGVADRRDRFSGGIPRLPVLLSWSGWQGAAFSTDADIAPRWGFRSGFERFVSLDAQQPGSPDRLRRRIVEFVDTHPDRPVFLYVQDREPGAAEPTGDRSRYLAVRSTSDRFAAVLDALREVGRYEDALVVLVGAHGAEWDDAGDIRGGSTLSQEQLHVPLVIKPPAGSSIRGEVTEAVSLVDLFPTLLPLLGVAPPANQAGRRLPLPGETGGGSEVVRSELQLDGSAAESLISWPWKYLRLGSGVERLYDLAADPREERDLREAEPDVLAAMRRALDESARQSLRGS